VLGGNIMELTTVVNMNLESLDDKALIEIQKSLSANECNIYESIDIMSAFVRAKKEHNEALFLDCKMDVIFSCFFDEVVGASIPYFYEDGACFYVYEPLCIIIHKDCYDEVISIERVKKDELVDVIEYLQNS
jgi:hypothetical protein